MRILKTLRVGDVVTADALSRDDYFLCVTAGWCSKGPFTLVNIGPDRFREVILTDRMKRVSVESIEELGRCRRHDHMVERHVFSRS